MCAGIESPPPGDVSCDESVLRWRRLRSGRPSGSRSKDRAVRTRSSRRPRLEAQAGSTMSSPTPPGGACTFRAAGQAHASPSSTSTPSSRSARFPTPTRAAPPWIRNLATASAAASRWRCGTRRRLRRSKRSTSRATLMAFSSTPSTSASGCSATARPTRRSSTPKTARSSARSISAAPRSRRSPTATATSTWTSKTRTTLPSSTRRRCR